MIGIHTILQAWNQFFFTQESALPLALFRIGIGTICAINCLLLWRNAPVWYGPEEILSPEYFKEIALRSRFSVLMYLPSSMAAVNLLLSLYLIAAICLTIGFFTRISCVVLFLCMISLDHRNWAIVYGADQVLRIMVFLLIFSMAGETLSIDHLSTSGKFYSTNHTIIPWVTRLIQLQIGVIYARSFFWKRIGSSWRNGTAVYYILHTTRFRRRHVPKFFNSLNFSKACSWTVMLFEAALLPLLLIRETRNVAAIMAMVMHFSIDSFTRLHLFGAIMIICMILWITPESILAIAAFIL